MSKTGCIAFVSAQGGNVLDSLNRRRQAQCPGWTFEKYRAYIGPYTGPYLDPYLAEFEALL